LYEVLIGAQLSNLSRHFTHFSLENTHNYDFIKALNKSSQVTQSIRVTINVESLEYILEIIANSII